MLDLRPKGEFHLNDKQKRIVAEFMGSALENLAKFTIELKQSLDEHPIEISNNAKADILFSMLAQAVIDNIIFFLGKITDETASEDDVRKHLLYSIEVSLALRRNNNNNPASIN